jgi:hypothetical protein
LKHYDQVLIAKEDYGSFQTLDYMFEIIPFTADEASNVVIPFNNKKHTGIEVDYTSSQVEYFLVSNKPYQQLSDHFGLSVALTSSINN